RKIVDTAFWRRVQDPITLQARNASHFTLGCHGVFHSLPRNTRTSPIIQGTSVPPLFGNRDRPISVLGSAPASGAVRRATRRAHPLLACLPHIHLRLPILSNRHPHLPRLTTHLAILHILLRFPGRLIHHNHVPLPAIRA